jgi:hypothetical protein
MRWTRAVIAGLWLLAPATPAPVCAQERPLPDLEPFLSQARSHLRTDRQLLSQYTFRERETELRLTKFGKLTTGPMKVYEVYPGLDPDDSYRRLVEVDGKPRDLVALERDDRQHQKRVLEEVGRRERETASDREKRLRREVKERREHEDLLDDLYRAYTFTIVARQPIDGNSTVVVDFHPRPNAIAKTDEGKNLRKMKGRAWISEDDYELARVEVEMLEDLSVRGFLAKLYMGTTASFERRKINGEAWLPTEISIKASGRALIRKFHIDMVVRYSDYRKFSVQTDTEFALPHLGANIK